MSRHGNVETPSVSHGIRRKFDRFAVARSRKQNVSQPRGIRPLDAKRFQK
jgi:hypothetical protein